jgi:hypothetical protein
MAHGPDPNRMTGTDPDASPEEERKGDGLGNPRSTRLGLSSWGIAGLVLLVATALLVLFFY